MIGGASKLVAASVRLQDAGGLRSHKALPSRPVGRVPREEPCPPRHLAGDESGNRRNGYGHKTVLTEGGSMGLSIPRDRTGTGLARTKWRASIYGLRDQEVWHGRRASA